MDSLKFSFDEITRSHGDMWLAVIPQLIAMLDLEVPVRGQVHELLAGMAGECFFYFCKIIFYNIVMFYITFCFN
jgi:hypothetical protein